MSDSYKIYASKDYVDSKGLPEGQVAHQQLVTDADGSTVWVERDFYKSVGATIVPNATYGIYSSQGQHVTGTFVIPTIGEAYHVVFGDIETDKIAVAGNQGVRIGEDYSEFIIEIISETQMYVETANSGPKVIEITQSAFKKIDKMFLPDLPHATEETFGVIKTTDFAGQKSNTGGEIFNDYSNNVASGALSHAENSATKALGSQSHAEGSQSIAEGESSHAEGYKTYSLGYYSHAEGSLTKTKGNSSHAEGIQSIAEGKASHVEGYYTVAKGKYSHAEGNYINVIGDTAHGEGYNKISKIHITPTDDELVYSFESGYGAYVLPGYYVKDTNSSFVEILERDTSALTFRVKEPLSITTETLVEISEGLVLGNNSHAEGHSTTTVGEASHAEGYCTHAEGDYQHVQGKNNIIDKDNKFAHIVGNGTTPITRSNAHTIDWDGNGWFAGGLKVGGTDQDDEAAKDVILAPTTATVGQVIAVKTVDENGKPTEWEAADMVDEANVANINGVRKLLLATGPLIRQHIFSVDPNLAENIAPFPAIDTNINQIDRVCIYSSGGTLIDTYIASVATDAEGNTWREFNTGSSGRWATLNEALGDVLGDPAYTLSFYYVDGGSYVEVQDIEIDMISMTGHCLIGSNVLYYDAENEQLIYIDDVTNYSENGANWVKYGNCIAMSDVFNRAFELL